MRDEQARGQEASLLRRIEIERGSIEEWKKQLDTEDEPFARELFRGNIRDAEASIAECWKKIRELREEYNL